MTLDLSGIIKEITQSKGISEDLILTTIESALTKAYEKYYGTIENLVLRRDDDLVISIFSKKEILEEAEDDLYEISLEEAKKTNSKAEIGDSMLIPVNPEEFGRVAVHSAKQIILQRLKEIEKNTLFSEYKSKEGKLIIGYIQREKNGNIFIDLGNFEGILPKENQSSHEFYHPGEKLRTLVEKVKHNKKGNISVILTRSSADFVRKLIEVEIPEIEDKTVQIINIVREAGYRTKIAVHTDKDEIDPVGACVGQKGARIQNIIKELEGEKIDILEWNIDIRRYIENSLTPAEVKEVIITNDAEKKAIAIVDESQLSFAIGKRGSNIKLVNQLTEWSVEVKTQTQAIEEGLIEDHIQKAEDLFKSEPIENEIDDLELPAEIKITLNNNNVFKIEHLIDIDDFTIIEGLTTEQITFLENYIDENFEIVEEDTEEVQEEGEEQDGVMYYECPECGASIPEDAESCPNCGIEIAFEEDEDEEDSDE